MTTADQGVGKLDLEWTQGDKVTFTFTFTDIDLSTHTWEMQVRQKQLETATLVHTFTCTPALNGTDTVVTCVLAAVDNAQTGRFFWDLQSTSGTAIRTWVAGRAVVRGGVTV